MFRLKPRLAAVAFTCLALGLSATGFAAGYGNDYGIDMPAKKAADGTLTDASGMTLYTFDKDMGGTSACSGNCAKNWPPLTASASAKPTGDWGVIMRDDGTKQWTYDGKPLYRWVKDTKPGDRTGDGLLNNSWHVAKD